jgi:hypothetical protein
METTFDNLRTYAQKAAPKSRLYDARALLALLGGLGRLARAGFVRC